MIQYAELRRQLFAPYQTNSCIMWRFKKTLRRFLEAFIIFGSQNTTCVWQEPPESMNQTEGKYYDCRRALKCL